MLMWVSRITGTWRWTRSSSMSRRTKASGAGQMSHISAFFSVFTPSSMALVHTRGIKSDILCFILNQLEEHIWNKVINSIYWYNSNFNNQIRLQSEKTRLGNAIRRLVSFAVDIHNQKHQNEEGEEGQQLERKFWNNHILPAEINHFSLS